MLLEKKDILTKKVMSKVMRYICGILVLILVVNVPVVFRGEYSFDEVFSSIMYIKDGVSNTALYLWNAQFTGFLIIFTLLGLISERTKQRTIGVRISRIVFNENIMKFNFIELFLSLFGILIISTVSLIVDNEVGVIISFFVSLFFMTVCFYYTFVILYKQSRIYHEIEKNVDDIYKNHQLRKAIISGLNNYYNDDYKDKLDHLKTYAIDELACLMKLYKLAYEEVEEDEKKGFQEAIVFILNYDKHKYIVNYKEFEKFRRKLGYCIFEEMGKISNEKGKAKTKKRIKFKFGVSFEKSTNT